jgi:altronate dehydratase large subunit
LAADLTFKGFLRPYGSAGCRNYVAVIPTVFCANEVALAIAAAEPDMGRALVHHCGCGMLQSDIGLAENTLIALAGNANVGAVILVGLGCEASSQERIRQSIAQSGKPIEGLVIQQEGNSLAAIEKGTAQLGLLARKLRAQETADCPISKIRLAVKCGSSDATSGLAANLATGKVVDELIDRQATVVFGETTEFIGAEHILSKRGINQSVRNRIVEITHAMEDRIRATGLDMRGTQPSRGNIAGGISTIEEKSLGAISKSGSRPINGVLSFAQPVQGPGLFIIDTPGKEDISLTAAGASGANVIVFTTGGGAPQGFPLVPVIKVASNPQKVCAMKPHIDVDVSQVFTGEKTLGEIWPEILRKIIETLDGKKTAAEILGYDKTIGIPTCGPLI